MKRKRQRIADPIAVCGGEFITQPKAVAVFIIGGAVRHHEGGYGVILAYVQRKRLVLFALDIKVDGQIARRPIHAVDRGNFFQVLPRKALFRIKAVVGVVGIVKEFERIDLDRFPFHRPSG